MNFLFWLARPALWLLTVGIMLLSSTAGADEFICTCQQDTCGNGAMNASKGKVMQGIPNLSLERMFGPSRTGAEKTGWVCESADALAAQERQRERAARAARAGIPLAYYTCVCTQKFCGGIGIIEGKLNEQHKGQSTNSVRTNYAPTRTGGEATGWQCTTEEGSQYKDESTPGASAEGNKAAVPKAERYACTCNRATCGGKDGILEGEQGQRHSGVAESRLETSYGPALAGDQATGWNCKPDAPLPPKPKYTCTCSRDTCGGKDGLVEAERGQRHTGISAARVESSYGPARTGDAATGWSCVPEQVAAAPRSVSYQRPASYAAAERSDEEDRNERSDTKAGIVSLELFGGAALAISGKNNMGTLIFKPAVAVNRSRSLYLILPLQAQLASGVNIVAVGFGLQYDVALTKNLYLTPRFSLGYTASLVGMPGSSGLGTVHLGNFTPEMGLKYIFNGRVNLGVDLVSIPIVFDKAGGLAFYRLLAMIGVNF